MAENAFARIVAAASFVRHLHGYSKGVNTDPAKPKVKGMSEVSSLIAFAPAMI